MVLRLEYNNRISFHPQILQGPPQGKHVTLICFTRHARSWDTIVVCSAEPGSPSFVRGPVYFLPNYACKSSQPGYFESMHPQFTLHSRCLPSPHRSGKTMFSHINTVGYYFYAEPFSTTGMPFAQHHSQRHRKISNATFMRGQKNETTPD